MLIFSMIRSSKLIHEVNVEKGPDLSGYHEFMMSAISGEDQEDIRSFKVSDPFSGLRGMAAYAYHAYALDYVDKKCP